MDIIITCETTQYAVLPNKKNEITLFSINEESFVISFCDKNGKVLEQSEICIEDARKLAKLILL